MTVDMASSEMLRVFKMLVMQERNFVWTVK